jgi:hypothetical protein
MTGSELTLELLRIYWPGLLGFLVLLAADQAYRTWRL